MSTGINKKTVVGDDLLDRLKEPFEPRFVKWRVGATNAAKTQGIALAYLDVREVMKRLDEIFGVTGWQVRYSHVTDKMVVAEIGAKIGDEWIWKANGAGDTQVEAEKGSLSDAMKRAAVVWGIGRYLYYLPNVWAKITPNGKSYKLAEIPELPAWALPTPKDAEA